MFGIELGCDVILLEVDLLCFVDLFKDFNGKIEMEVKGICFKCVMFLIDGFVDVDLWGKEVLCDVNGDYVGCLILGGYFVYFGK